MSENILCQRIAALRRERGMTQEQLASQLGLTYQAVSKWENGQSCPDVMLLPVLADIFGVRVDDLFGRETAALVPAETGEDTAVDGLPWPDDDTLYAVLFKGHRPLTDKPLAYTGERENIRFTYSGPALNIVSHFDIRCEDCEIVGSVSAEGDVSCETVGGDVNAGGNVSCGDVGGGVNAGGDVDCSGIEGEVSAGGDIDCAGIHGNVSAGGDIDCAGVTGNIYAGGDVDCGGVTGSVSAGVGGEETAWRVTRGKRVKTDIDLDFSDMSEKLHDLGEEIRRTVTEALDKAARARNRHRDSE